MMSEYFSEDGKRHATIQKIHGSYRTTLFENFTEYKSIVDDQHSLSYWESCCENWVNYWGDFSK
jgi:hypothetical protein